MQQFKNTKTPQEGLKNCSQQRKTEKPPELNFTSADEIVSK